MLLIVVVVMLVVVLLAPTCACIHIQSHSRHDGGKSTTQSQGMGVYMHSALCHLMTLQFRTVVKGHKETNDGRMKTQDSSSNIGDEF